MKKVKLTYKWHDTETILPSTLYYEMMCYKCHDDPGDYVIVSEDADMVTLKYCISITDYPPYTPRHSDLINALVARGELRRHWY